MNGRGRQGDWPEYQDRARQPLGPGTMGQKRGRGQQRPRGAYRGDPSGYQGPAPNGTYGYSGSRRPQMGSDQRNAGGRSRFAAILVLIVAAVIVVVGGLAATEDGSVVGAGETVSISILPFPGDTSTSVGQ